MRQMPIHTHIQMNHNDNINQRHQADQTEACSGSVKQIKLCPTAPNQYKMQGADDRQKVRSARRKIQHRQNTPQTATIARNASDTMIVNAEQRKQSHTASLQNQRAPQGTQKCPKCGQFRRFDTAMRHIPIQTHTSIAYYENINQSHHAYQTEA
jgi:hypothetical protein